MSLWGLKEQADFESGRYCYDCGALIIEPSEGEERLCEECQEADEKCDKYIKKVNDGAH